MLCRLRILRTLHLGVLLLASACGHAPLAPRLILSGRYTARADGAREGVALASLRVPLERARDEPLVVAEPATVSSDAPSAAELQRYRDEPSAEQLVARALASGALDPRRASEARERARLSGLLPIVRADVRRGSGWDLRTQQGVTADTAVLASDDSWSVVGSVTFRLDRLLYAREESSLLTEERRLEAARLHLVTEIVRLYFERRRLQLERDRRGETDLVTEARIAELGAMLDALTDGGMSQRE